MKTTITGRGQISIPAELRREMNLSAGQTVIWERHSDTECRLIIVKPSKIAPDPRMAIGFAQRNGLGSFPTKEWMGLLREGEED